MILKVLLDLGT